MIIWSLQFHVLLKNMVHGIHETVGAPPSGAMLITVDVWYIIPLLFMKNAQASVKVPGTLTLEGLLFKLGPPKTRPNLINIPPGVCIASLEDMTESEAQPSFGIPKLLRAADVVTA